MQPSALPPRTREPAVSGNEALDHWDRNLLGRQRLGEARGLRVDLGIDKQIAVQPSRNLDRQFDRLVIGDRSKATAAAEQARARVAQERDSARASQIFLGGGASLPSPVPVLGDTALPPAPGNPQAVQTLAGKRRDFLGGDSARPTESAARIVAPSSPNVVQAGSVIPAALITGIRSDLPGQVTAQVTQNVYDSPTGRILLIPQGARLIGEYDSEIADGQNRVLLVWERLILPGGRSLALDRQPGADASGRASALKRKLGLADAQHRQMMAMNNASGPV